MVSLRKIGLTHDCEVHRVACGVLWPVRLSDVGKGDGVRILINGEREKPVFHDGCKGEIVDFCTEGKQRIKGLDAGPP